MPGLKVLDLNRREKGMTGKGAKLNAWAATNNRRTNESARREDRRALLASEGGTRAARGPSAQPSIRPYRALTMSSTAILTTLNPN